jgi:hypothetical protein
MNKALLSITSQGGFFLRTTSNYASWEVHDLLINTKPSLINTLRYFQIRNHFSFFDNQAGDLLRMQRGFCGESEWLFFRGNL